MANKVHVDLLLQGVEAWNLWRKQNPLITPDLSKAKLSGNDFRKVDLNHSSLGEADLTGANLSDANLTWADLSGADLTAANLEWANLSDSTLRNADLSATKLDHAELGGVDLSGSTLSGSVGKEANFSSAKLSGAILIGARFVNACFVDADLTGADLRGADISEGDLENADLILADLRGARLRAAWFYKALLVGADCRGADFRGANLSRADLKQADLAGADLRSSNLAGATLDRTNMLGANLAAFYFRIADLLAYPSLHEVVKAMGVSQSDDNLVVKESKPSETLSRFPDVSMPTRTKVGERCTLRVAVTQQPVTDDLVDLVMTLEFPGSKEDLAVDVLITAHDFEVVGSNFQNLVIPVDDDSKPILFELIPNSTGEKLLRVEFFQYNKYVGGRDVSTTVVESLESPATDRVVRSGIISLRVQSSEPPDLTILISKYESDENETSYQFTVHSPSNGLFYRRVSEVLSFSGSPSKWMEGLYAELGILAGEGSLPNIQDTLSAIGSDLYEQLFPLALKDLWTRHLRKKVSSIQIVSDEPWIPWELVKPSFLNDDGEICEDGFLCQDYLLARWLTGFPPPSKITVTHGALILAASGLQNAEKEAEFVLGLGNVNRIEPRLAIVRRLLQRGGYELMHFVCHAKFDVQQHEESVIELEDDVLVSRDISGVRRNFGRNKPLVFINACYSSRADFSLVGVGSWANKFIDAQSSAFLGTSWEVDDELAYRFSTAFYESLRNGKALAEAVRSARLSINEMPNSTWLAYTLYGDPMATVEFSSV